MTPSTRRALGCSLSAAVLVCAASAFGQTGPEPPEPAAARAHVAEAKAIAGRDLAPIAEGFICKSPAQGAAFVLSAIQKGGPGAVTPVRAFPNLAYVGLTFVGAWVLKTPDGLIVWDALDNEKEARDILVPGIRSLGWDPATIRDLIVTHGHYDHFGGARYLQKTFGAKVFMSAADWDYMNDAKERERLHLPYVEPPVRDQVIADGSTLTLGGTTVRFILTPGHTPGTVSSIFEVKAGGGRQVIAMWGGTAMPKTSRELAQYHDSLHRFWSASSAAGATTSVSTHAFILGDFERTKDRSLVLGREGFERMMRVYDACVVAQGARYAAWGW